MEWINAKRDIQKNGETVLCCDKSGAFFVIENCKVETGKYNGEMYIQDSSYEDIGYRTFTHWMPLPEPPTDKPGVLKTIYETPEICECCYAHLSLEWSFCPECGHVTPWADGESMMNQ